MTLFTLAEVDDAAGILADTMRPTPAYAWPLLRERLGVEVVVKHENHAPTGAFKVRGGHVYFERMRRANRLPAGVVAATRGNHGQSVALAARRHGLPCAIVVPHGNSPEKNAAMRAFGAELIVFGKDFEESRARAAQLQGERGYHCVPPFHGDLICGVATYARELFAAHGDLDSVYVPIGMGSGICGLIAVRDLLGLKTEIVGVVARNAAAYARSVQAGRASSTTANTFADGIAVCTPNEEALAIVAKGAARVVQVSEDEIAAAIRLYVTATHNLAEGAAGAALAGLAQEKSRLRGRRVGVILSGGNIDLETLAIVLGGATPRVAAATTAVGR